MKKVHVSFNDMNHMIKELAPMFSANAKIYGVPRGGVPVAMAMAGRYGCYITDDPKHATHIVDDLIDSGATRDKYEKKYPKAIFVALYDKIKNGDKRWYVFPWEKSEKKKSTDDIFVRLLQMIGEDPKREGLKMTPERMAKAWLEWTQGYHVDEKSLTTVFKDGADNYDELVLEKNLPFYSHCEHHMVPFFGVAHIAYIPADNSVIGISKLGRILDMYSQRLQIQERLTTQIADCIERLVAPVGIAVVIEARHLCTESGGLKKQGQSTITSAMRGAFKDNPATRNEFMLFIKG